MAATNQPPMDYIPSLNQLTGKDATIKNGLMGNTTPVQNNQWRVDTPQMTNTPQVSATHSTTAATEAAKTGPVDLVENRVAGIVESDSPLMQLAATRANQRSGARGLINTSMAVGEGQKAVLDAATPIAMADSGSVNQADQFNTSNQQQANLQNATQTQRTSELNAAADNTARQTNTENAMRTELANLDISSRQFMADIEQKNKQLIQTSANAATLFNTYQQQIAQIMISPNLDAAGKERAIANLQAMLTDSLAAQDAVSGLDLSGIIFDEYSPTQSATQTNQLTTLQPQISQVGQPQILQPQTNGLISMPNAGGISISQG